MSGFSKLKSLSIANNQIAEWTSINALHQFPVLSELRIDDNPIQKTSGAIFIRSSCIARIQKLDLLNGSNISNKERLDCEKYYLKLAADERISKNIEESEFFSMHPRYKELAAVHGDPYEALKKAAANDKPKMSLICMILKY